MNVQRHHVSLAALLILVTLITSCVGFLWAQNDLLHDTAAALAAPATVVERNQIHISRIESVDKLRALAISQARTEQQAFAFVATITRSIRLGLMVLGGLLLLALIGLVILVQAAVRIEPHARP